MSKSNQSLISAFDALLGPPVENKPPAGFFTIQQIAKRQGKSENQMGKVLRDLVDAKKVQRIKGRNDDGRVCWFYGIKTRAKPS